MIRFRPLVPDDFQMLLDWLQQPHVKEWWDDGEDTLEKVSRSYSADPEVTKRFVMQVDEKDAGYFQYYPLDPGEIGVDLFLATADDLSKGLGTQCLLAFLDLIADTEDPRTFVIDPDPANKRAIRCYEKCGFEVDEEKSSETVHYMVRSG